MAKINKVANENSVCVMGNASVGQARLKDLC